jgi:hypothetical protein
MNELADPLPDVPRLPDELIDVLVAEIVAAPRPARTRRRRRRTALVAVLAVLAVPATAVAIDAAGIHTGIFPSEGDTEMVPGEELLQLDSPDIVPYVREITRGIPLPDGASWEPFLARWPLSEPTLAQETAIGSQAEWFARCAWIERGDRRMVEESWTWRYSRGLEGLSGFPIEQVFKANCR